MFFRKINYFAKIFHFNGKEKKIMALKKAMKIIKCALHMALVVATILNF